MKNMASGGITVVEKPNLPVITEELIIDDGLDNELEDNRRTL